jgi:ribosomal protein L12E/L44/L45/RPP1/RPP2
MAAKSVTLPPHLWEALESMSQDMGVGQEALIAQAVFMLARLNGYVVPGTVGGAGAAAPAAAPARPAPAAKGGRGRPAPAPEPEPEDEGNPFDEEEPLPDEPMEDYPPEEEDYPEEEPEPPPPPPAKKSNLTLNYAGHPPIKMATDVLTIGRGKTCDFVIDSNRVSREHARITREGGDFILEDLNSSNGTFFGPGKEKISKKKLKDGDEFTLGTEKIKVKIGR